MYLGKSKVTSLSYLLYENIGFFGFIYTKKNISDYIYFIYTCSCNLMINQIPFWEPSVWCTSLLHQRSTGQNPIQEVACYEVKVELYIQDVSSELDLNISKLKNELYKKVYFWNSKNDNTYRRIIGNIKGKKWNTL